MWQFFHGVYQENVIGEGIILNVLKKEYYATGYAWKIYVGCG